MNKQPNVSIIVPCYNVEKYVENCLKSLIVQTYENLEIICVDDGSSDSTTDIIERYVKIDGRIRLIRQRNQYAGVARNNGLKYAIGKYVLFFDSDDFCDENMVCEMVTSAEKNDSDIVVCDARTYDEQMGTYDEDVVFFRQSLVREYEKKGIVSYKDIPDYILLLASSGPWNKLYKRDFIEREGLRFQASKRDNDEFFVLMSMALAVRISWVSKKFVNYRVNNPNSLQGFGDGEINVEDIVSTARALKAGLVERERYELLKKGMQNQFLIRYVGLIEGQRSWINYKKVFDFTKKQVFKEFEIEKMKPEDVFFRAAERLKIMECTAEEYMFWQWRRIQNRKGERYSFPYRELKGSKRIGLYGAGVVGRAYYRQICADKRLQLVGWYDISPAEDLHNKVELPNELSSENMEKIVIAVEAYETAEKIKKFLIEKGFEEGSIVWKI